MKFTAAVLSACVLNGALAHTLGPRSGGAARQRSEKLERRQTQYNDATFAQINDPNQECNPYYVPAVNALLSGYPAVWETADILPSDTAAQAIWQKIQASGIIPPGITPKGLPNGNRSGVNYNAQTDPDCDWTASKCDTPKHPGLRPDIIACPEPHTWGLSFDDGPNCTHNAFYDFLKQNNQKATMFYIGSNVMDWPLQAQRGLTDGHILNCHTWSHQYMTALTDTQVFSELYYTIKAIKEVVGVTVTRWRPPYGDVDDRVRAIATGLGLETVLWTDDTDDWEIQPRGPLPKSTIDANYAAIIAKNSTPALEQSGIIVLTHEITGGTMEEAMQQYPAITAAYKNVAPVEVCLNNTTPYYETDIVYPNFAEWVSGKRLASGLPDANTIKIAAATFTPRNLTQEAAADAAASSSASAASTSSNAGHTGVVNNAAAHSSAPASSDKKSGASALGTSSAAAAAMALLSISASILVLA